MRFFPTRTEKSLRCGSTGSLTELTGGADVLLKQKQLLGKLSPLLFSSPSSSFSRTMHDQGTKGSERGGRNVGKTMLGIVTGLKSVSRFLNYCTFRNKKYFLCFIAKGALFYLESCAWCIFLHRRSFLMTYLALNYTKVQKMLPWWSQGSGDLSQERARRCNYAPELS